MSFASRRLAYIIPLGDLKNSAEFGNIFYFRDVHFVSKVVNFIPPGVNMLYVGFKNCTNWCENTGYEIETLQLYRKLNVTVCLFVSRRLEALLARYVML